MMSHNFFFGNISENPEYDYSQYYDKTPSASLHDDIYSYIWDSVNWIESFNPAMRMKPQTGLNLTGVTVLKSNGARKLVEISKAWSNLFVQFPPELRLKGGVGWIQGENSDSESYDDLVFDRDNIVANFDQLASLCLKVAESDNAAFVMHYGL